MKKQTIRRVLSLMLVLFMVLSVAPKSTFANEAMSDEFKAILNDNGKFVMNSVVPKSENDIIKLFLENEDMWEKYQKNGFEFYDFAEDYKSCTIGYNYNFDLGEYEEEHIVDIEYIYDENVKKIVDDIIKILPKGEYSDEWGQEPYYYSVKDMELVNYWVNTGAGEWNINNLIDYSGELKELIGHRNFKIDARRGDDGLFYTVADGFAPFISNGVVYAVEMMGVRAEHVIYVPDNTGDTPEELMAAAMGRIDEYIGEDVAVIEGYDQGVLEFLLMPYDVDIALYEKTIADYDTLIEGYEETIADYEAIIEENGRLYEEAVENNIYYNELILNETQLRDEAQTRYDDCWVQISAYQNQMNDICVLRDDPNNVADYDYYQQQIDALQQQIDQCMLDADMYQIQKDDAQASIDEYTSHIMDEYSYFLLKEQAIYDKQSEESRLSVIQFERQSVVDAKDRELMYKQNTINEYNTAGGENNFLKKAAGDYYFTMTINENMYNFIIVKDSDKMLTPEYKSLDVTTGVSVDSKDTSIPLDTLINVETVLSGEKYEEIKDILDVDESFSYDIKLFSNSRDNYVTKLPDGEFKVSIPISEEYYTKDLMVYFVDENKEIHDYDVVIDKEEGCAYFKTNHFSIYTLAVLGDALDDSATGGDTSEGGATGGAVNTGDSNEIRLWYVVIIMSAIFVCIYRKKYLHIF